MNKKYKDLMEICSIRYYYNLGCHNCEYRDSVKCEEFKRIHKVMPYEINNIIGGTNDYEEF